MGYDRTHAHCHCHQQPLTSRMHYMPLQRGEEGEEGTNGEVRVVHCHASRTTLRGAPPIYVHALTPPLNHSVHSHRHNCGPPTGIPPGCCTVALSGLDSNGHSPGLVQSRVSHQPCDEYSACDSRGTRVNTNTWRPAGLQQHHNSIAAAAQQQYNSTATATETAAQRACWMVQSRSQTSSWMRSRSPSCTPTGHICRSSTS